ncbi:hypothetical protein [uncultured Clostridium sp.]|uniref:hypothetical protein n=1 Tax=uncultured Clostridium sp. TaxID=59620 RepID=UPI0025DDF2D4|nr:hypothetical protein [uncultured Clostridium sp.]
MDDMSLFLDLKNEKELLRVYENNLKNAKNEAEKNRWDGSIVAVKNEINHLEAMEKIIRKMFFQYINSSAEIKLLSVL